MKNPLVMVFVCVALGIGCGDDNDNNNGGTGGTPGAGGTGGTNADTVNVTFAAEVDGVPFVCGNTYDGLGSNDTSLELSDFRFYVQDIELKNADGEYVPLALAENDWQVGNVVLMDFEDGCGDLGNDALNAVATGTAAGGPFTGLRFTMGVPFDENHDNPATAPSPLNLDTMHWNWQGGYKFLRIDSGNFEMTAWRMHLGSTACDGDTQMGGTTSCANPNRVEVEFDGFDPGLDVVVADFARLVDGSALDENLEGTPVGCMSGPMDTDCGPLFDNLGLPFGGSEPSGDQVFFSAKSP